MKKIIAIAICSVCCANAAAQSSYTLEQLLDSARQNNITVRNARQGIEAARQQRKETFTKYFPNISATGLWFNANKGMAQTAITPSEFLPTSLGETFAQLMPQQVLLDMSAPVSVSMLKNGTIAGSVYVYGAASDVANYNSFTLASDASIDADGGFDHLVDGLRELIAGGVGDLQRVHARTLIPGHAGSAGGELRPLVVTDAVSRDGDDDLR